MAVLFAAVATPQGDAVAEELPATSEDSLPNLLSDLIDCSAFIVFLVKQMKFIGKPDDAEELVKIEALLIRRTVDVATMIKIKADELKDAHEQASKKLNKLIETDEPRIPNVRRKYWVICSSVLGDYKARLGEIQREE